MPTAIAVAAPPCTNCRALELRVRRLEADEDGHVATIEDLTRKLAHAETELAKTRALCRRLGRDIATVGGVLSGRLEPDALVAQSCN